MHPLSNDATTALLRALHARLGECDIAFEEISSRSWASATFVGARHELILRLDGDRAGTIADAFANGLEEAEFQLRGHILADIALAGRETCVDPREMPGVRLRIEALTVEDC